MPENLPMNFHIFPANLLTWKKFSTSASTALALRNRIRTYCLLLLCWENVVSSRAVPIVFAPANPYVWELPLFTRVFSLFSWKSFRPIFSLVVVSPVVITLGICIRFCARKEENHVLMASYKSFCAESFSQKDYQYKCFSHPQKTFFWRPCIHVYRNSGFYMLRWSKAPYCAQR